RAALPQRGDVPGGGDLLEHAASLGAAPAVARKASPGVGGVWGLAVWSVVPQESPSVTASASSGSSVVAECASSRTSSTAVTSERAVSRTSTPSTTAPAPTQNGT